MSWGCRKIYQENKDRYDNKNNCIEEVWLDENNEELDRFTFKYDFDKRLNWVVKIMFRNAVPVTIKERELEYFQ